MAIQTKLEHMTNRDLFSNYYLENLLCESNTWNCPWLEGPTWL